MNLTQQTLLMHILQKHIQQNNEQITFSPQTIATRVAMWSFWNCLLELKWFGNFLTFYRKERYLLRLLWTFIQNILHLKSYKFVWVYLNFSNCTFFLHFEFGFFILLMAKFGIFNFMNLATLIATAAFPHVLDLINGLNWHAHG